MTRPIISLGDAVRCQAKLSTSGIATVEMLRMLGFDELAATLQRDPDDIREEIARLSQGRRAMASDAGVRNAKAETSSVQGAKRVAADEERTPVPEQQTGTAAQTARPRAADAPTRLRWLNRLPLSDANASSGTAPLASAADAMPPPAPVPLFPNVRRRAILTAAITSSVPDDRLDIGAIITAAEKRRPLTRLPRLRRQTIRRGLQLLVDRGAALAPFWRDEDTLVTHLRELLGRGRLEVHEFWGFPRTTDVALDDEGDPDTAPRWRSPRSGTPVVIVSDFSIGTPAASEQWVSKSQWFRFAAALAAQGSTVVGLIPYSPDRWPAGLTKRIGCIPWSERTTVGAVRKTILRLRARTR